MDSGLGHSHVKATTKLVSSGRDLRSYTHDRLFSSPPCDPAHDGGGDRLPAAEARPLRRSRATAWRWAACPNASCHRTRGRPRGTDAGGTGSTRLPFARMGAGHQYRSTPRLIAGIERRLLALHAKHGPLNVAGFSLGGIFARLLAHLHPDKVRHVATICSPFREPVDSAFLPLRPFLRAMAHAGFAGDGEQGGTTVAGAGHIHLQPKRRYRRLEELR